MIKKILTPLDLSDHTEAATFRACEISKRTEAVVTGLTVVDTDGIIEATALPFHAELINYPSPLVVKMLKDAAEQLDSARDLFQERCKKEDVPYELCRLRGNPVDGILDVGRFTDLLVMGMRNHFHIETEVGYDELLAHVLDGVSVPVLLTPARENNPIQKVLIAYDGSPSSTRALQSFCKDFWPVYQPEVRVVTSTEDKKKGEYLLINAADYLTRHGVKDVSTELTGEPLEKSLEERGLEWADVVVAGVRSKSPLKRLFVGSFTRWLIKGAHCTLYLSQ